MTIFWSQDFNTPTWLGRMHQAWVESFLNTDRNVLLIVPGAKEPFEFHGIDIIRPPLNVTSLPMMMMSLERKNVKAIHFLDPQQGLMSLLFQLGLISFAQMKKVVTTLTFLNSPTQFSKKFFSSIASQVDAVFYSHPESLKRLQHPKLSLKESIHTGLPVPVETEYESNRPRNNRVVVPGPFADAATAIQSITHLAYDSQFKDSEIIFCHGLEGLGPKDRKFVTHSPVFGLIQSRMTMCEHSSPARDLEWLESSTHVELRHLPAEHIHHQVFQQLAQSLKLDVSLMPGSEMQLSSSGDLFGNSIQRWYSQIEWQKKSSPNNSTSASSPKNSQS